MGSLSVGELVLWAAGNCVCSSLLLTDLCEPRGKGVFFVPGSAEFEAGMTDSGSCRKQSWLVH